MKLHFYFSTLFSCCFVTILVTFPQVYTLPTESLAELSTASLSETTPPAPPSVEAETWEEWRRCNGFKCDVWEKNKQKIQELNELFGTSGQDGEKDTFDGDILFSPDQAEMMIEKLKRRQKRKLTSFTSYTKKWSLPIRYKFHRTHDDVSRKNIRKALNHWETHTCIEFKEYPGEENIRGPHLVFTHGSGCFSYIGQLRYLNSQPISLSKSCQRQLGVAVHEIGHAIGFWHEHQRSDRDDYVTVNRQNIDMDDSSSQWSMLIKADTANIVPYDYGSIMHYWAWAYSKNKDQTLVPKDELYLRTIGQKTRLSFFDSKLANLAYCKDTCVNTKLPQPCENRGYQDPKNCRVCRCPDGFGGVYCEQLAPSTDEKCGGTTYLGADKVEISSPGYNQRTAYPVNTECNWLFKAPAGQRIVFRFDNKFGVYCTPVCFHWAEIRYKKDLSLTGPRFCCYNRPDIELRSEGDELMVLFRSNYTAMAYLRRGFKAVIKTEAISGSQPIAADRDDVKQPSTTRSTPLPSRVGQPYESGRKWPRKKADRDNMRRPVKQTTKMTSATTSTTPRPLRIVTRRITMERRRQPAPTTRPTNGWDTSSLQSAGLEVFSCNFETSMAERTWCQMKQSKNDHFDWTINSGRTATGQTGPNRAYNGRYYIYIEASNPRKPNDLAIVYIPRSDLEGRYCLTFYYCMFGYHVNTLQVISNKPSTSPRNRKVLWEMKGQQGAEWLSKQFVIDIKRGQQIGFVGVRGKDFLGDIALDNIKLHSGSC